MTLPAESVSLTIAIPTYNRPQELRRLLALLGPQLNARVHLLVVDNHSDTSAASVVADCGLEADGRRIRVVRNRANLGAGPNLLRCFELTETEWIWIIGDDDQPTAGAVERVLRAARDYPDAAVINFSSGLLDHFGVARTEIKTAATLGALPGILDSFSNLLFISANLYRSTAMVQKLRLGHMMIPSFGPHVAMILAALQDGAGSCVLHSAKTIEWEPAPPEQKWNYAAICNSLPDILGVVRDKATRYALAELNARVHPLVTASRRFWEPGTITHFAVNARQPRELAIEMANYLSYSRARLLSSATATRSVAWETLGRCALLLCAPGLQAGHWLYRRVLRRKGELHPRVPTDLVESVISDKRL